MFAEELDPKKVRRTTKRMKQNFAKRVMSYDSGLELTVHQSQVIQNGAALEYNEDDLFS